MMSALPQIVWYLDDPVADPALVPLYFVAKKAAEYVTVVLGGEGADEFFAGYPIYREPLSLQSVQSLPKAMRSGLRAVSKAIPEGVKGKSFLERGTTDLETRFVGNANIYSEAEKQKVLRRYDPSISYTDVTGPIYAECEGLDDTTRMQYVDMKTWLRGDILVKADRMSMAHSLEVRVPFLDVEVFKVASKVPLDEKVRLRGNHTKYALRQALNKIVPPAIVNRPKMGFPTRPGCGWRTRCSTGPTTFSPTPVVATSSTWSTSAVCCVSTRRAPPTTAAKCGRSWCSACGTRSSWNSRLTRESLARRPSW